MNFGLTPKQAAFLESFRTYLDTLQAEGVIDPRAIPEHRPQVHLDHVMTPAGIAYRKRLIRRLGADGWLGISWPIEYGGRGLSNIEQWLVLEELSYKKLPHILQAVTIMGPVLIRIGSQRHKQEFLPKILAGEVEICIGYTEPNAGTDLASLQTKATRRGDGYVVNGQKVYSTGAEFSSHVWLAARTGEATSRHRGISVFLVPLETPGVTVRPMITAADYRTNEIFFDDVRVGTEDRIGEENEGWRVITMALDFERVPHPMMKVRQLRELVEWANQVDPAGARPMDEESVRGDLAEAAIDIEIARLMSLRIAVMMAQGEVPNVEASTAKVWYSEMYQRVASSGLSLMGEVGQVGIGAPGAPAEGVIELDYREAPVRRFAAGANEIQRDIIAQRGLGLPRAGR